MISARGLTKTYGALTAVDDLSFEVAPGAVTGFLGPNGAGKSTTLRMALGLDRPTAGTITVAGRPYRELAAPAREVGALLDPRCAHPGHTAAAHLGWMARAAGLPRSRVDEVLGAVGLADAAGRRVGGFSLGMRQRLGIAGALLGDPGVLLLDEPLNGLDPAGIRWIRTLLRELADQGRTVLVSSHLMHEMEHTASRVVVIADGRLVDSGELAQLRARATTVRVAPAVPEAGSALVAALRAAGAEVSGPGTAAADADPDDLQVRGMSAADVGRTALAAGIALRGLVAGGLEESFLALVADHRVDPQEEAA